MDNIFTESWRLIHQKAEDFLLLLGNIVKHVDDKFDDEWSEITEEYIEKVEDKE